MILSKTKREAMKRLTDTINKYPDLSFLKDKETETILMRITVNRGYVTRFIEPVSLTIEGLEDYGKFRVIDGIYNAAVTKDGVVANIVTKRVYSTIMSNESKDLYPLVRVNDINHRIHRLVAMAWCKNDDYMTNWLIDHIDGDKKNFHASNLRWTTPSINTKKGIDDKKAKEQ